MVEYHDYEVKLSKGQIIKLFQSHRKGIGLRIRLSKSHVNGVNKLLLTQTQLNKILKATTGVQLNLSAAQIKHMEKSGGFLPLAALIPLIISGMVRRAALLRMPFQLPSRTLNRPGITELLKKS